VSAALQLDLVWGAGESPREWPEVPHSPSIARRSEKKAEVPDTGPTDLPISLAFYRKHTERMLRRYLYASMQVGRAPSILCEPVGRGWVSSRRVRTFEDAVIFVLDVERCLDKLDRLDRMILSRIVLQEYTQVEAAVLLGMSPRAMSYKFPRALDRLTEKLLAAELLMLPER
jgi:Sigma-70, region 4